MKLFFNHNSITILFLFFLNSVFSQVSFTAGDILIMQIGDGGVNPLTSKAYAEYIVEVNPNTSVVQNVIIPNSTSGARSVESGSATSDADLNISGDGKLITFTGYDANTGTASIATANNINRVVCQINNAATVTFPSSYSGSIATKVYSTNNIRSAVTYDGTGFWTAGTSSSTTGGIYYIPSGTLNATAAAPVVKINSTLTNARIVKMFNNQLYGNASSGAFQDPFIIGSGLPISSGQTLTVLPGLPNTHDSYSFAMFDRDNNGVLDLMYLADCGTTLGSGGVRKYYLNGSTWTAAGILTGNITGIAGYFDCNNNPMLYFSTIDPGSSGSPNEVYSYNDVSLNSTVISGSISSPTCSLFMPTQTGYVYRGIAMAPNNGSFNWNVGSTNLSGAYKSIIISGGIITLTGNISASDSIYVGSGATLICGTRLIKGKKFVLASGATLKIGSTTGITASSPSGNVQTTCRTYSSGANYEYNGTAAQATGNGLPSTVNDLTINNSSVTGVTLTNAVTVSNVAYFTSGLLKTTSTNLIAITSTGSVSGVSNNSFVNGPVRKIGNTAFTFPTGKGIQYAPISISSPALSSDHFTAEYFNSNPDPTYSNTLKDPTIDHISSCEYWVLGRTNGTSNVSVSLSYDSIRSCGVTNLTDLLVAHWDLSLATPIWKDMGVGAAFGTTASGTVSTSSLVTSFSPFTLASISLFNPLPIELLNFNASYNYEKNAVDIKWQTATEINNDFFTIERSLNAFDYEELSNVDGAGNSIRVLNYSTTDFSPFNGLSYYRLKQTDFDGNHTYSRTVSINTTNNLNVGNVFPNPATDKLTVEFNNQKMEQVQVKVFNCLGEQMYFNTKKSESNLIIDLSGFSDGIYMLQIDRGEKKYQQKFIKK
ncbi:MAG: T9SS type A sorting domain-containing protein [Bacteroidetes bacterium]|nr:T9SS type A sorting domain-containing protein [Bacteroidota bacterium]